MSNYCNFDQKVSQFMFKLHGEYIFEDQHLTFRALYYTPYKPEGRQIGIEKN